MAETLDPQGPQDAEEDSIEAPVAPVAGGDFKNFQTPQSAPDTFDNEGPGGFSQEPEQTAPAAPAADDPLAGTPGGSAFLQKQRAPLVDEIRKNPALYGQVLGMALMEDSKDPAGPIESLFNRAAYTGYPLSSLLHPSYTDENGKFHQGFYSGINKGMLPGAIEQLATNDDLRAKLREGLQTVIGGSNRLKGATDQGGPGDPNAGTMSGRIFPEGATPGAIYNDWGGGPGGVPGAAQWRQAQQAQVNAVAETQTPSYNPDVENVYKTIDKAMGPVGQGRFDGQSLPPSVTSPKPVGGSLDDIYKQIDDQMEQGRLRAAAAAAKQVPGSDYGTLGSALKDAARGLPHGILSTLGLPADLFNFMDHYYAAHPMDALPVGSPPEAYEQLAKEQAAGVQGKTAAQQILGKDHVPLGAEDLEGIFKNKTGIDLKQADDHTLNTILYDMGSFIGAGAKPTALGRDALALATGPSRVKTALSSIFHNILAPAGASGGLDLGDWAADKYSPDHATAQAIGIGSRVALGLAGFGLAARAGNTAQQLKEAVTPQQQVQRLYEGTYGDQTAGNAAKAQTLSEVEGFDPANYPPGYEPPAFTRTANEPLIQLGQNLYHSDMKSQGKLDRNFSAMNAFRPEVGVDGDPTDAVNAVQNMQNSRQQLIDMRVDQARQAADQAERIALAGTSPGGEGKVAQFDKANAVLESLRDAREDMRAHTDDQWDVARAQGFLNNPATPSIMYDPLERQMAESIRLNQGTDFPWQIVRDLYESRDPKALFDRFGTRVAPQGADQLFTPDNMTLEQLKGVDTRLGNAIRIEQDAISSPGSRGDPMALRGLVRAQQAVRGALDQGIVDAGNPVALRTAMDATAQYHNTFTEGPLGRLLAERGVSADNASTTLSRYLQGSQKAVLAGRTLQQAVDQRTGAAALRTGDPSPPPQELQQHIWDNVAGWMRQSYANVYQDSGPKAAAKWLEQQQGFFHDLKGNPTFDNLNSELYNHSVTGQAPELAPDFQKKSQADINRNTAQVFLNGKGYQRLDDVFAAKGQAGPHAQASMMRDLISDAKLGDDTGRGLAGLKQMVWDRLMLEAQAPDLLRGGTASGGPSFFSARKAADFMEQNQPAFGVLRREDHRWSADLDRIMNAMVTEDRQRLKTGLDLPGMAAQAKGWRSGASASTHLAQLIAGRLANKLNTRFGSGGMAGSMAVTQHASAYMREAIHGSGVLDSFDKLEPLTAAQTAISEALNEGGEKLRGLLAPINGPSGHKWAAGIEPWLRASGVMLPQGWLNPDNVAPTPPGQVQ